MIRYITLADDDHQPLGIVAYGGADWTLNCGQCTHSRPSTRPDAAVTALLAHIEGAHRVPVVQVLDPATGSGDQRDYDGSSPRHGRRRTLPA